MKSLFLKKKVIAALMAGMFAFGSFTAVDAASRAELAAINVQTAADFQYWEKNAPTKKALVKYVQDVTNPKSKNYIPPEDRIATFDLDGTLYCETAPYYFQEMMFLHRALEDKNFAATPEMKSIASKVKPYIMNKEPIPKDLGAEFAVQMRKSYAGMTKEEYSDYVKKFMETNEVGLTNLKRGENNGVIKWPVERVASTGFFMPAFPSAQMLLPAHPGSRKSALCHAAGRFLWRWPAPVPSLGGCLRRLS